MISSLHIFDKNLIKKKKNMKQKRSDNIRLSVCLCVSVRKSVWGACVCWHSYSQTTRHISAEDSQQGSNTHVLLRAKKRFRNNQQVMIKMIKISSGSVRACVLRGSQTRRRSASVTGLAPTSSGTSLRTQILRNKPGNERERNQTVSCTKQTCTESIEHANIL